MRKSVVLKVTSRLISRLLKDKSVTWFKAKGDSGESNSFLIKAAMAVAVLLFIAYLAYKGNRRGAEIARLKHERDLAAEEEKQAKLDWELSEVDAVIEEKTNRLVALQVGLAKQNLQLKEFEEDVEYERFKIEAIKNWDDMDSYIDAVNSERSEG
jgi:hypothetical protein